MLRVHVICSCHVYMYNYMYMCTATMEIEQCNVHVDYNCCNNYKIIVFVQLVLCADSHMDITLYMYM